MKTQTTLKVIATLLVLSALSQPAKSTDVAVCVHELFGLVKNVIDLAKAISEKNPFDIIHDVEKLIQYLDIDKIKQCEGITIEEIKEYIEKYIKKEDKPCINEEIELLQDGKKFLHYAKRREILHIIKWGEKVAHDCHELVELCKHIIPEEQ